MVGGYTFLRHSVYAVQNGSNTPHSSASSLPSPQWSYPSHFTMLGRHKLFLHLKSVADLHSETVSIALLYGVWIWYERNVRENSDPRLHFSINYLTFYLYFEIQSAVYTRFMHPNNDVSVWVHIDSTWRIQLNFLIKRAQGNQMWQGTKAVLAAN